jgi:Group II intron, maturase-specific domain
MIADLNPVIRGWGGYYSPADVTTTFRHLDAWIRMRLRSKVIKRKSTGRGQARTPVAAFYHMGLASLTEIRRRRLSPA